MMSIEKIKQEVESKKGEKLRFCFHGSRGQTDKFHGIITDTYPGVFLVKSIDDNRVKSFSYSDILIENLVFDKES